VDRGGFVVAWEDPSLDGDGFGIFGRRLGRGGAEFAVNSYTTHGQTYPSAGADGMGNFVVAWQSTGQDLTSTEGVFAQRFSPDIMIDDNVGGYDSGSFPSIAANAAGEFVVVWDFPYPAGGSGRLFDRFGRARTDMDVRYADTVAMAGRGSFVVGWMDYGQVFSQRFSPSGRALGSEFKVPTDTTCQHRNPSIAMDDSGSFVVVWESDVQYPCSYGQDGSGSGIFGQRYDSAGTAQGGEFRVNSYTTGDQDGPSISMAASGQFVVVWHGLNQYGSGDYEIFGQRYDSAGGAQGGEFQVNSATVGDQLHPSVSVAASGEFVVVWTGNASGHWDIFAQRYDSSGAETGAEFRVNSYTSGDQRVPKVAMDAQGNFAVVWRDSGRLLGDFGQFYDGAGSPVGGEFQISSLTETTENITKIAAADVSRFILAFSSGVYGENPWKTYIKRLQLPPCVAAVPSLEVETAGGGSSLKFTWPNVYDADSYVVYEKTIPYGAFFTETGTASDGSTGLTVPMPADSKYYLIAARKASCGEGRKR
jgi:hypothetical protein